MSLAGAGGLAACNPGKDAGRAKFSEVLEVLGMLVGPDSLSIPRVGFSDEVDAGMVEPSVRSVLVGAEGAGALNMKAGAVGVAWGALNALNKFAAGRPAGVSEVFSLTPGEGVVGGNLVGVDDIGAAAGKKDVCGGSEGFFRKSKTPPEP